MPRRSDLSSARDNDLVIQMKERLTMNQLTLTNDDIENLATEDGLLPDWFVNFSKGNLQYLNLEQCSNLLSQPNSEKLLFSLSELKGCGLSGYRDDCITIFYPDFSKQLRTRLSEVTKIYKQNNPSEPEPSAIKTLFDRFLDEDVESRGGTLEIVKTAIPILEAISRNPSHLRLADKIASTYLEGCVNQPVAGFSEISALMSIAQEPKIMDKIEAAKHLMTLEVISAFVNTLGDQRPTPVIRAAYFRDWLEQNPDATDEDQERVSKQINEGIKDGAVDVEAGNALLREVHEKLLQGEEPKLKKPWFGVPKAISYESTIAEWLTPEIIDQAYGEVARILRRTPSEMATYLCEGAHKEAWAEIVFPRQVLVIKESFAKQMDDLETVIAEGNSEDAAKALEASKDLLNKRADAIDVMSKNLTTGSITAYERDQPSTRVTPVSRGPASGAVRGLKLSSFLSVFKRGGSSGNEH